MIYAIIIYTMDFVMDINDDDNLFEMNSNIDSDSDDEYDDDDNFDIESDTIFREDAYHLDSDKLNNVYYIGLCNIYSFRKTILYVNSVSQPTFYKHSYCNLLRYLKNYSIFRCIHPKIDIMKLHILRNGTYTVIVKTLWLKLVQRRWKNIYKKRMDIIRKRCLPSSQMHTQRTGKYPFGLNILPSISGMMSEFSLVKSQ